MSSLDFGRLIRVPTRFAALGIILDLITKNLAANNLDDSPFVLIPGVFELRYIKNTGAAFSFLEGAPWVFLLVTPIIMILILFLYLRIPKDKKFLPLEFCFAFILSGAIGNYIDRLSLGYVRDFLYFSLINFPVFNVADIFVTVSVFSLIFLCVFVYKEEDLAFLFPEKKHE